MEKEKKFDVDTIDDFNWYYKDLFNWKNISDNNEAQRDVYLGVNKKDPKDSIILKKIKIKNYKEILKEIYFLVCFQNNKHSIKLKDFFLSDNYKIIFIILKDEGINLYELIDYTQKNNDVYNNDFIKDIIFQIIYQLYIFHKNNLVHNDIKPENILISSSNIVKITDFGSMDKIGAESFGTISYRAPENILIKAIGSEKNDLWSVGLIMIKLYKKGKDPFIYTKNKVDVISFLRIILSKYKIIMNNKEISIDNNNVFKIIMYISNLNNNESVNFKAELKKIDGIEDPEAFDLIKNLLKINPKERFSAEEALNHKYLSQYKNKIEQYNIYYKEKDYKDMLTSDCNLIVFINNLKSIHQKFIGLENEKYQFQ